jgi:CRISPR-associated protein Cas1
MSKRIIVISTPSRVNVLHHNLVIRRDDKSNVVIPTEDVGLLLLEDTTSSISTAALAHCLEMGTTTIVCNDKHLPTGLLLPLEGHTLQSAGIQLQAQVALPRRKRLWQEVIRAKIRHQAESLSQHGVDSTPVAILESRVRSGDPDNVEARAARIYWPLMFGESFRRDREASGTNALLNYGYALIRAAMARALVGAGLSPSLGLHHHNQYNAYCLADDMFEPLRPLVDHEVRRIPASQHQFGVTLETKKRLLLLLTRSLRVKDTPLPVFEALVRYSASLRDALQEGHEALQIPRLEFVPPDADEDSDDDA